MLPLIIHLNMLGGKEECTKNIGVYFPPGGSIRETATSLR